MLPIPGPLPLVNSGRAAANESCRSRSPSPGLQVAELVPPVSSCLWFWLKTEVLPVRKPSLLGLAAVAMLVVFGSEAVAGLYTFTPIVPPGTENDLNAAFGINNSGQVVGVTTSLTTGLSSTFIYSNGTFSPVSFPGSTAGFGTSGFGINNSGQVVGQYGDTAGNFNAFLFSGGNNYTTINPPQSSPVNPLFAEANSINNKGQILISAQNANGIFSFDNFLYSNGVFTPLTAISSLGTTVFANGINDAGTIVGYATDSSNVNHGFILNGSKITPLDDPNAQSNPFSFQNGTNANGINNSGEIVGFYSDANGNSHGFVYQNGVFTTVDDPLAANGTEFFGVNDSGQIVGFYLDANFAEHAFLATPTAVPEPASLSLAVVGGLVAAGWQLRKRAASAGA
jgi:probable HAF family extracellular repeat protein